ncbi:hypothetical protein NC652_019059 [Populus alba x Populus x berolinensis]|nr:hypothetical protein NC652_019059 [Populus alba x Populus x berolinensis]
MVHVLQSEVRQHIFLQIHVISDRMRINFKPQWAPKVHGTNLDPIWYTLPRNSAPMDIIVRSMIRGGVMAQTFMVITNNIKPSPICSCCPFPDLKIKETI